jgi:hypothetical protein
MTLIPRLILLKARTLIIIATIPVTAFPALQVNAAGEYRDRSVIGKWKVTSVLDFAEVSALDNKDAKLLVGKILTISPNKVQLGSRVCSRSEFWAERVEPKLDLREKAHASAANLGLPNPVIVVELSCAHVYIKNRNRIVLAWDGAFFDAVRTN